MRLSTHILTARPYPQFRVTMICLGITLLMLSACDRVQQKGSKLVDQTQTAASEARQHIRNSRNQLVDQVFPSYDHDRPDTRNNRQRFKEHLLVEPTDDVQGIYTYGDFLGADYKVLLAFSCNQATIDQIVAAQAMQRATGDDHGLLFSEELSWWDQALIETLVPYKVGRESVGWAYLWYDPQSKRAFYEEFSL